MHCRRRRAAVTSSARTAAVIWLLGTSLYLICEAVAAAGKPGYRYAANYISDLGTSAVMNVGAFMMHGVLFGLGAVIAVRAFPGAGRVGWAFVAAAAANTVGNVLVGTFHSGMHGPVAPHVIGAGLAIAGGNVAALLAGFGAHRIGLSHNYSRASIALGVVGIGCLLALPLFPVGVVERGAVYPIIAWELMTGIAILCASPGRGTPARRPL
ncbi:hypothetical protein BH09ACT8_BH09ACT8_38620 [soil metagenome]